MSQQSTYKYMKKHPNKWFTAKELSETLKLKSAGANLTKLAKHGAVEKRIIKVAHYRVTQYRFKD